MPIRHPRLIATVVLAAGAIAGISGVTAVAASSGSTGIPVGQSVTGKATYYDDAGYGACGRSIDASRDLLVAVSHTYWTTANPNVDPLCSGISVQVTYQGTTITVPVEDKCPTCDGTHIDLSLPAFRRLGDPDVGVLTGLTWKFVETGGTDGDPAPSASTGPGAPDPTTGEPTTAAPTSTVPTTTVPTSTVPTTTVPTTTAPTSTAPTTAAPTSTAPTTSATGKVTRSRHRDRHHGRSHCPGTSRVTRPSRPTASAA